MGTWSFPKGKRSKIEFNEKNPGPGDYNPNIMLSNKINNKHKPSSKLGSNSKERKEENPKEIIPGPGDYNISDRLARRNQPKFSFGSHISSKQKIRANVIKSLIRKNDIPGPGQYEAPSQKTNVAFTMGSRHNSEKSFISNTDIGVATELHNNKIGISFPKSKRDYSLTKFDSNPGPGSYINPSSKTNIDVKSQNGFGFGKKLEDQTKSALYKPGPGVYNIPSSILSNTAGFTMKQRLEDLEFKRKIKIPGPCDYNTESIEFTKNKSPICLMRPKLSESDSKSKLETNFTTPGPGSYLPKLDLIKKAAMRCKMSNTGRNVIKSFKQDTPGPGTYIPESNHVRASRFSKSKRSELLNLTSAPGPGSYNPKDSDLKNSPSYTLRPNNEKLKAALNKYKESVPGPGNYNPSFHKKANSIGFGSSGRTTVVPKNLLLSPGPGSYNLPSKVAEVPYYEMNNKK